MSHSDYALFDRFPDLEQRLPRIDLMAGPSPVHRLERLASGPGLPQIWVKRDDRCAIPYGGNKPRKLELLLAQARALGCRAVLTVGGLGSNHALATCIHGARNGFEVHVLLFPQPVTDHVRMSLRLFSRHATRMSLGSSYEELPRLVDRYLERATASPAPRPSRAGSDMYYIPAGGSTGLGAIGFVNAGLELARQVRAGEMPQPAAIFFPAGTCGTVAGLVVGLKMAGLDARVKAVRVVDPTVANRPTVLALAREAVEILARADRSVPSVTIRDDDFDLLEGYFGAGYGAPTQQGLEAIARMRDGEGILLEPTYSGKALAALLDHVERAPGTAGPVLFWNTFAGPVLQHEAAAVPDHQVPDEFRRFLDPTKEGDDHAG